MKNKKIRNIEIDLDFMFHAINKIMLSNLK